MFSPIFHHKWSPPQSHILSQKACLFFILSTVFECPVHFLPPSPQIDPSEAQTNRIPLSALLKDSQCFL